MNDREFRFVSGDEYLALPSQAQTWVIEPLIPAGGLVNIYGKPKEAKKTWMGLNMALAVSNGWETLMGRFPVRTWGPVVYLQVDTPRPLWRPRLELYRKQGHDISMIYLADPELVPFPMDLLDEESNHTQVLVDMIQQTFGNTPPVVVFIDTLREVHGGDEDKSTVMRNVVARLRKAFAGSAIVLISHSRKGSGGDFNSSAETSDDTLMDENRGSGYVAGRMDTIIRLTPKYMSYQGRAVGKERLKIEFNVGTGLYSAAFDPIEAKAKTLDSSASTRSSAKSLARDLHISEEAARSALRRRAKAAERPTYVH